MHSAAINSTATSPISTAKPIAPVASTAAPVAAVAPEKPPIFVGGLVNWSSLMTPDTMRAMFELHEDGSVKTTDGGFLIGAGGRPVPQDSAAERLIVAHVLGELHKVASSDTAQQLHATDDQKKFFRDVTGYNLVVEDGLYNVVDDDGNPVPDSGPAGGAVSAVWQLASEIVDPLPRAEASESGGAASKWFADFVQRMKDADLEVPQEWLARAEAHFGSVLDSEPQNFSGVTF